MEAPAFNVHIPAATRKTRETVVLWFVTDHVCIVRNILAADQSGEQCVVYSVNKCLYQNLSEHFLKWRFTDAFRLKNLPHEPQQNTLTSECTG